MLRTLLRPRIGAPTTRVLISRASTTSAAAAAAVATMTSQNQMPFKVEKYTPTAASWPYSRFDFARQDEDPDTDFYASPKYVTHIDDNAIEQLAKYYDEVLPQKGKILDFCSSWVSHYPDRIAKENDVQVYGMGLNQPELDRNPLFGAKGSSERRSVQDLNSDPDVSHAFSSGDLKFTASTCTVSIDYLAKPLEVLTSLRHKTEENGTIHLAISNRAFWHKVVARWMELSERERLEMVGDYLWFAGWREVEIVTVEEGRKAGGGSGGIWGMLGMGGRPGTPGDPLWVVRGRNVAGIVKETGV